MTPKLAQIVAAAYAASYQNTGSYEAALRSFYDAKSDPEFLQEAEAEAHRSSRINPRRCVVSKFTSDFISDAMAYEPAIEPTKDEDMTSKLKGLADLAKSVTSDVESRAGASLDRLSKAQERAHGGLDKLDNVTAEIEKSATDIENFANQISNGPPTE